jgi:hypothetical protein
LASDNKTTERTSSRVLEEAFRAAHLLTGCPEAAESAVLRGIAAVDFNHIGDDVLVETAKAAIQCRADFPAQWEPTVLPLELQRLLLLAPTSRDCFILRVLLGMDVGTCCRILPLGTEEFCEALYAALQELPTAKPAAQGFGSYFGTRGGR